MPNPPPVNPTNNGGGGDDEGMKKDVYLTNTLRMAVSCQALCYTLQKNKIIGNEQETIQRLKIRAMHKKFRMKFRNE